MVVGAVVVEAGRVVCGVVGAAVGRGVTEASGRVIWMGANEAWSPGGHSPSCTARSSNLRVFDRDATPPSSLLSSQRVLHSRSGPDLRLGVAGRCVPDILGLAGLKRIRLTAVEVVELQKRDVMRSRVVEHDSGQRG